MYALPGLLAGLNLGAYSAKKAFAPKHKPLRGKTPLFAKRGKKPVFNKRRALTVVRNDGQGNQIASFSHGRALAKLSNTLEKKIRYSLQPQNTHLFKDAGRIVAATGTCTYATFTLNDVSDLSAITDIASDAGDADNKNGRIHIKDSSSSINLTNMDAGLVQLRVYELIYRRDVPKSQIDLETMVVAGFQQQNGTAATNTEYQDASTTLYNNPLVCCYAKIIKVRNIMLGTGKSIKLTMDQVKGRDINPILFGVDGDSGHIDDNRDIIALQRFTRALVIQVHGQNVSDSSDAAQVTIGPVHLAYTEERRYHWSQPYNGSSSITTAGSFGAITHTANLMSTSGNGNVVAENNA